MKLAAGEVAMALAASTFRFQVYGPLAFTEAHCDGRDWDDWVTVGKVDRCHARGTLRLRFTNALDEETIEDAVVVRPEIPDMVVSVYGDTLEIAGATARNTTYTVHVTERLRDAWGQSLPQSTRCGPNMSSSAST